MLQNLIEEWDTERNGRDSDGYSDFSSAVVWWKCKKDPSHVWQESIKVRTKGRACPVCKTRRVNKSAPPEAFAYTSAAGRHFFCMIEKSPQ